MPIDHDTDTPTDVVREGPGWRQTTPPPNSNKGRTYLDCAPSDDRWEATDDEFTSMTAALRQGFPTDFTGPTKWNQARWTWANRTDLISKPENEAIDLMVQSSGITLNKAADRGTGMHSYLEDRLLGRDPDWEFLEQMGSLPWIAAAENFLVTEQPIPKLVEVVCFSRQEMIAGMCDAVLELPKRGWSLAEIDYKSREQKSRRDRTHARRPKEGAQLGGYFKMLTAGYYMDDRGRRQQVPADDMHIAVVTFGTDGTYAVHEVDPANAVAAYECAMDMRERSKTSFVMPFKPDYSDEWDGVNQAVLEAIQRVPEDSPEYLRLTRAWLEAGLGRPSQGELRPEEYGVAMHIINTLAAAHQPFADNAPERKATCTPERQRELLTRLQALPDDIRTQAEHYATGVASLLSSVISVDDADDWERVIVPAELAVAQRRTEIENLKVQLAELGNDVAEAVLYHFPDGVNYWTDGQIDHAACIWAALVDGHIELNGNGLKPTAESLETLARIGKRVVVQGAARTLAEKYGLPRPSKWDDLASDPLLYAVVVTA